MLAMQRNSPYSLQPYAATTTSSTAAQLQGYSNGYCSSLPSQPYLGSNSYSSNSCLTQQKLTYPAGGAGASATYPLSNGLSYAVDSPIVSSVISSSLHTIITIPSLYISYIGVTNVLSTT